MSINKYQPHIFVFPEDDANRQLATGFALNIPNIRRIQILPEAGGWTSVRDHFVADHIHGMRQYNKRTMILLIDFDDHVNRLETMRKAIPDDLSDRVFVLGTLTQPEALRAAGLGSYEAIGRALADDCRNETTVLWQHALLRHNQGELSRFRTTACGVLI